MIIGPLAAALLVQKLSKGMYSLSEEDLTSGRLLFLPPNVVVIRGHADQFFRAATAAAAAAADPVLQSGLTTAFPLPGWVMTPTRSWASIYADRTKYAPLWIAAVAQFRSYARRFYV